MTTELVKKMDGPLREAVTHLAQASRDLTALGHELTVDFQHSKKIKNRAEDLEVGRNIIDTFDQILRGQKTIAEDYKKLMHDAVGTFQLADAGWSRIQAARTVEEYNEAVDIWNGQMGSETPMSLGETAAVCARNTRWLRQMILRVDALRHSTYHLPEIASSTHDLVSRSTYVPDLAEKVQNHLTEFCGFLSNTARHLPAADPEDFVTEGDGEDANLLAITEDQAHRAAARLREDAAKYQRAARAARSLIDDLEPAASILVADDGQDDTAQLLRERVRQLSEYLPTVAHELSACGDVAERLADQVGRRDRKRVVESVEALLPYLASSTDQISYIRSTSHYVYNLVDGAPQGDVRQRAKVAADALAAYRGDHAYRVEEAYDELTEFIRTIEDMED